ncbi:MAG: 4-hydroxythreonine-4-phosphate dehydrogenase PdxA [Bacteroidales bacterium]|nr:4-hydroxythreonine-4-phosphate dehydrogenase PdxA [Bacteroidales bacterium]
MEKTPNNKYIVGITQGDINGIGYEIIFKALADPSIYDDCTFVIYGSSKIAAFHRKMINLGNIVVNNANDARELVPNAINIINVCDENSRVDLGSSTMQAGECALAAIHRAQNDLKNNMIDILINAPFNYASLMDAGFKFAGVPEFMAHSLDCRNFVLMMLGSKIRIATATSLMPLSEVPHVLSVDKLVWKIKTLNKSLRDDFAIRKPRIAVLGFNPYASDYGIFGQEENEILQPAIDKATEEGIVVFGPYCSDSFFASEAYTKFDAVLALSYDQAVVPFRIIEGYGGVCYTGGLPTICTAPLHGPAYDIAGKGEADDTSMRNAIYRAVDILNCRKMVDGITPLRKQTELEADKKIC